MSLSLWAAEPAILKGTPAVAKRILPPPPMVFRPDLGWRHFQTLLCFYKAKCFCLPWPIHLLYSLLTWSNYRQWPEPVLFPRWPGPLQFCNDLTFHFPATKYLRQSRSNLLLTFLAAPLTLRVIHCKCYKMGQCSLCDFSGSLCIW